MKFSYLANKFRSEITRFSGILSQDLDKTARRFIQEAVYGIMASQSVMLTEIGRQLESRVSLISPLTESNSIEWNYKILASTQLIEYP